MYSVCRLLFIFLSLFIPGLQDHSIDKIIIMFHAYATRLDFGKSMSATVGWTATEFCKLATQNGG